MIDVAIQLAQGDFELHVAFTSDAPVLGLFGSNGAGKSTLVRCIAGLERGATGRIVIDGRTLLESDKGIDLAPNKRRVGVVFQEALLFPHYSVRGNLLYGSSATNGRFDTIVELLALSPLLSRRPAELSGGERQRAALGRAILSEPQVLVLDEPMASLDVRLRRQILPYLRSIQSALSIPMISISHDLTELLQLTDELLVLDEGRVVGCGRYSQIIHESTVAESLHDRGMTNVLGGKVVSHDQQAGVSFVSLGDKSEHRISVPRLSQAPGERVSLALRPWDIALAKGPVEGVSIQNQLSARVVRSTALEKRVLVELDLGSPVICEISRRSAEDLGIEAGGSVTCLIKSHAFQPLDSA